jgi:membrane associated rhomboid family serine protease
VTSFRDSIRQSRITRGALVVLVLEAAMSIVWLFADDGAKASLLDWVAASPTSAFDHLHVWTLATSPLLEVNFVQLIMSGLILWMFVPTLERFWGTPRFYRFVAITSIAGTIGGCLVGLATHTPVPIVGLGPFTYAAIVAFGITYPKQQVMFSFYIKLTGRQLMFGFLALITLVITLQQKWEEGGAYAAAIGAAALLTSRTVNPGLAWKRWRIKRARARLTVLEGGKPKRDEQRWVN